MTTDLTTLPVRDFNELYNALTVSLIEMVEGSAVVGFSSENSIYSLEKRLGGGKSVILQLMTNPRGNNYSLRVCHLADGESTHQHWVEDGSGTLADNTNGFVHLSTEMLSRVREAFSARHDAALV